MKIFQIIRDWSEVWALLIPLTVILVHKPKGTKTSWLILYVIFALVLNIASTIIAQFHGSMPSWLKNNNILYNLHSVARVIFFSLYIGRVRSYKYPIAFKLLLMAYIGFIIINFNFIESALYLSPNLFAAESIILLIVCLLYFFRSLQDESDIYWLKQPSFLVCAGVCFYEVITFFVFLFFNIINYSPEHKDISFADILSLIYMISFVILCILLAMALYKKGKMRNDTGIQ